MALDAVVSKLNTEALGKAVVRSDETTRSVGQGTPFQEMLTQMDSGLDFAQGLGMGNLDQDPSPLGQMQSLGGDAVAFSPVEDVSNLSSPEASDKVLDMLGEVNKGQIQMDSLVNHVLYSGKRFSNQELLVIQAHVFHYAQMTELTVKVAEQGVSSVKSVLNTQVQ